MVPSGCTVIPNPRWHPDAPATLVVLVRRECLAKEMAAVQQVAERLRVPDTGRFCGPRPHDSGHAAGVQAPSDLIERHAREDPLDDLVEDLLLVLVDHPRLAGGTRSVCRICTGGAAAAVERGVTIYYPAPQRVRHLHRLRALPALRSFGALDA
jgi:hypothetical protein